MDRFDLVVIGAGTAGEAATHYARSKGASVAVIDRALFGGSCPFWACMPSKALLHAAAVHHAGGDYPWRRASDFRDYMINRQNGDQPDDSEHVRSLEDAGATVIRGSAALAGPGRVRVDGRELEAGAVILAVGPTGVELAQVYARYGVPVTLIHPRDHVNDKDHPRSTELLAESLERDGVTIRLNTRATAVRAGEGSDGAHVVEVDDGDPVE